jgi:hypothetical protein
MTMPTENDLAASKWLTAKILELLEANNVPPLVAANAILNALGIAIVCVAEECGGDPVMECKLWATDLCSVVELFMRQAPMTAHVYLLSAIDHIDQHLGKGYAAKHPELIGAFMQTAALDFGASFIVRAIDDLTDAISDHTG